MENAMDVDEDALAEQAAEQAEAEVHTQRSFVLTARA
jgi:hypothetical protein